MSLHASYTSKFEKHNIKKLQYIFFFILKFHRKTYNPPEIIKNRVASLPETFRLFQPLFLFIIIYIYLLYIHIFYK